MQIGEPPTRRVKVLAELRVKDLGVIGDMCLRLEPGLTALTGETGAGKTLVVGAINLLLGGRAGADVVRAGAPEARVDGRFVHGDDETILSRVVPVTGRSRAYVDGAPATASTLAERAEGLVDLHGQHDHQSLLSPATQRAALDAFGEIDTSAVTAARSELGRLTAALAALGGDGPGRTREIEMLRHQVTEIEAAGLEDPEEDEALAAEEARLSDAQALREAAAAARAALAGDGGAADRLGAAVAQLQPRAALADLAGRAREVEALLGDLAIDLAHRVDELVDDPERLEAVLARRRLLGDLRRKYGASLNDVLAFAQESAARLAELEGAGERAIALEREIDAARASLAEALGELAEARRAAAAPLGVAVQAALRELALPRAEVRVEVAGEGGGDVEFRLSANPGESPRPLTKVASGGELSRSMLALRLVLSGLDASTGGSAASRGGEPTRTIVFDEVDAGIGGSAAVAVGRALASVARRHQVLVVTHLPQVAAFADQQIAVTKTEDGGRVTTQAAEVTGTERVAELSRMLSGQPESASGRDHAAELLASAAAERAHR